MGDETEVLGDQAPEVVPDSWRNEQINRLHDLAGVTSDGGPVLPREPRPDEINDALTGVTHHTSKGVVRQIAEYPAHHTHPSDAIGSASVADASSKQLRLFNVVGLTGQRDNPTSARLPFWQGLRPEWPASEAEGLLAEHLMAIAGGAAFDERNRRTAWQLPPSVAVLLARDELWRHTIESIRRPDGTIPIVHDPSLDTQINDPNGKFGVSGQAEVPNG